MSIKKYLLGIFLATILVVTSFGILANPAYAGSFRQLNDRNFESEVLDSDIPVLIDVYASWNGQSKTLKSMLENVVGSYRDTVEFYEVDLDALEAVETVQKLDVTTVPTLIVFTRGKEFGRQAGFTPRIDPIIKLIERAIRY